MQYGGLAITGDTSFGLPSRRQLDRDPASKAAHADLLDDDKKKRILFLVPHGAREEIMSANWKSVKDDLDWSLNQGQDVKGRTELREAFSKGDAKEIGHVIEAFKMGQRDSHKLANLARCAQEDDKRLYNIGRKLIELKPS